MKHLFSTLAIVLAAFCCSLAQPNPDDMLISGYVYNTSGQAVSGWSVCVYSDTINNPNFYYYDCTTTNSNGYYSFYIPGGSTVGPNVAYHVYSWDCQNFQHDTLINNNQGMVNSGSHDFYFCAQNVSQCDAGFSYASNPGTNGFQFIPNSSSNSVTYSWNFGDGTSSQQQNPVHAFNGTGPYYVCLTVASNFFGCSDTQCDTIYPNQGSGCDSWFNASADSMNIFSYNFSGGSNSNVTSWYWDFGDGSSSTAQNPSHTYADSGIYYVCLTVNNCNSAYCDTLWIGQNNSNNCWAYFYSSPISNPNGTQGYQFTYQGTVSNATTYQWSFGDGTSSGAQNPIHYYTSGGPYTVCLTITDGQCSNTYCDVVGGNNGGNCQAYFTPYDSSGVYYFYGQSSGNNVFYSWDFGDGSTSSQQYPSHQYSSPGAYIVCLTVGDFFNTCSDSYCDTLWVDSTNTNGCQAWFQYFTVPGGATVFSAYGNGTNTTSYSWSFGNGTGAQGQTVTQNLPAGTYQVCLSSSDPATGCQSSYCQNVVIGGNNTFDYCVSGTVSLGTPNLPADVGIVYLITYDQQTNLLVAVQATTVDSSGTYSFCQVPAGQYLVKAALTQNSAYYWNYLPTYYGNSLFWNYAQQVNVSANTSGVDVWLIAGANQGGPGFIGGNVTQGANKTSGPGDPLANVQVMLLDMNNYPVAYVYSDAQGNFEFPALPYGTYKVWAEVTGLLTTPAIVTIGALEPSVTNIGIIISETEVTTGISAAIAAAKLSFGNVFPNPSKEDAFMNISSEATLQLNLTIYDIAGRIADSRQVSVSAGNTQVALQTAKLSPGIYTLSIQSADGSLKVSKKLVKTE